MKRSSGTARDFPRTARLNHLVHEIVAEELERIDDERLGFLTVVGVEVERDMRRAVVWYTTLDDPGAEPGGADVAAVLDEHRPRIQSAIGRQAHMRRTPELSFQPDAVIRQAERVEEILRDIGPFDDEHEVDKADEAAEAGNGPVDDIGGHGVVGRHGVDEADGVGGSGGG
jgi:ribosome-binding factor A